MPIERTASRVCARVCARVAAASIALAIGVAARAHTGGHGAVIEGLGPGGGRLAAVVLAADAEAGAAAAARGVAEWFLRGSEIEIRFWDVSRRASVSVPGPSELKWILLGGSLAKPSVVRSDLARATPRIRGRLESGLLAAAGSVEVILPGLGPSREKHVLILTLAR